MKFTDDNGNVGKFISLLYLLLNQSNYFFHIVITNYTEIRYAERPDIISNFFWDSNCVDSANHPRQYELVMKKMGNT